MNGYRWIAAEPYIEVAEHRFFMEQHLGRKLYVDEVVHHRNGNKLDNSLENLEVLDRAAHTKLHRIVEPIKRICQNCGIEFKISARLNYKDRKTCSRKCQGEQMWRRRRDSKA